MQNFVGRQIDQYRILERVGLGGMAVVYKAYDTRLERDVALKLIRTEAIPAEQHERLLKRFEREAKAQARLNHSHIIPVYDFGEIEGIPYLVLAYLPGGTLKERIQDVKTVEWALVMMIPIIDAVAYAHRMGVLHRDIKPSNIIFNEDDQPMLTDFGIAKLIGTNEATLTGTGLGVGTPEYMAPEQWQGHASPASDQYALGVILYELVTGQKPYTAETPLAVALKQINDPLPSPRSLNPAIPEDLENVLFKTLSRDPGNRYSNIAVLHRVLLDFIQVPVVAKIEAEQLAEQALFSSPIDVRLPEPEAADDLTDLHSDNSNHAVSIPLPPETAVEPNDFNHNKAGSDKAFGIPMGGILIDTQPDLEDRTTDHHPSKTIEKRRAKPLWLLWLVGVALGVGLLIGASRVLLRDRPEEPSTVGVGLVENLANQAVPSVEPTLTPTQSVTSTKTQTKIPTLTATPASEMLVNSPTMAPTSYRSINYPIIQPANVGLMEEVARFGEGFSGDLAWLPDGTTLAVSGRNGIYTYNTPDLAQKGFIETGSLILSVAYAPDGRLLAAGSWDGLVYLFDTENDVLLDTLMGHTGEVYNLAFSPGGEMLISGGADSTVRLWDTGNRTLLQTFEGHTDQVTCVAFSSDGVTLASGGDDRTVRLWDLESGGVLHKIDAHTNRVTGVAFSLDGSRLTSGSLDGTLALWHVGNGGRLLEYEMPYSRGVSSLALSPDGLRVLTSGSGILYLWYASNGALLSTVGSVNVTNAMFSPDGTWLAAVGDESVHLLDAGIGMPIHKLYQRRSREPENLILSSDGSLLLIEGFYANRLWDIKEGGRAFALEGFHDDFNPIAFSPDGNKLATNDNDNIVHVWDLENGLELRNISGQLGRISSLNFSPDGSLLAAGRENGTIELWEVESGALLHTLEGHSGEISLLAFSPDGGRLASFVSEGSFYMWDVTSGSLLKTIIEPSYGRSIDHMSIMPNGSLLAFGSTGRFTMWDIKNEEVLRRLYWNTDSVREMALSLDGKYVASVGDDKIIRLWETGSLTLVRSLEGHLRQIDSIAFSPDGNLLASGCGWGDSTRLWDVMNGELLNTMNDTIAQSLSFSPDGRMMVSVSRDGMISLWAVGEE